MIKLKDILTEKKNPFSTESPAHDPWVVRNTKKPSLNDYIRDG